MELLTDFGTVITLTTPPLAINVKLDILGTNAKHKDMFSDSQIRYLKSKSIDDDQVIIPISQGCKKCLQNAVVHGGNGFLPSRLTIEPIFPLELAFAITVNKAQGRTLENVILVLSERQAKICNMGLREIYVAVTRVRNQESVRLLLHGSTPWSRMESLYYIDKLLPDPSIKAFKDGFGGTCSTNWMKIEWDEKKAYISYRREFEMRERINGKHAISYRNKNSY